jgi:hypothetical protein
MDPSIGCTQHALREMIDRRREQVEGADATTLKLYGDTVAHVVAEMVETAG